MIKWQFRRVRAALTVGVLLLTGCAGLKAQEGTEETPAPASLAYAWFHDVDGDGPNFLAVIDTDPASPGYGQVIHTVPVPGARGFAHHTSHELPKNGVLPANDYGGGQSYFFDTSEPAAPTLKATFKNRGPYTYPHSFVELPNGNFLVTFQTKGEGNKAPGGLVELSPTGEMVRASDADDPEAFEFIRPYSLEILPLIDRVVSTSAHMIAEDWTWHAQVWRLSDLELLKTVPLPRGERADMRYYPMEPRVLGDGRSVMINTDNCGLYLLTDIDADHPKAFEVYDFGGLGCAIPLRLGRYWVQAVSGRGELTVLDISEPRTPTKVASYKFEPGHEPHWIAADGAGRRIILSGYGGLENLILLFKFDPETGALSLDDSFRDAGSDAPGLRTDRQNWPHGATGPALPHGIVFWPGKE